MWLTEINWNHTKNVSFRWVQHLLHQWCHPQCPRHLLWLPDQDIQVLAHPWYSYTVFALMCFSTTFQGWLEGSIKDWQLQSHSSIIFTAETLRQSGHPPSGRQAWNWQSTVWIQIWDQHHRMFLASYGSCQLLPEERHSMLGDFARLFQGLWYVPV